MISVRLGVLAALMIAGAPSVANAQERLSLSDAISEALRTRPILQADAARVSAAEGLLRQAAARPNAEFQFSNENLRPGQTYSRDVDTLAVLTQPLDLAGRRGARIDVAEQHLAVVQAGVARSRVDVIREVVVAYWEAREADEARNVLAMTLETFQLVVDYHAAQFRVGVLAEQDLLRVQLEQQRLKVTAGQAALETLRTRAALLKAIGRAAITNVLLTEPLEASSTPTTSSDDDVLAARPEVIAAKAAVAEAEKNVRLQGVLGRPEFSGLFGYKRTQLPDTPTGVNTLVAGMRVTVPWGDRNEGNSTAASAELRRAQALLEAARAQVLADYHAAFEEYRQQEAQLTGIVVPLRRDSANLAQIALAAYQAGGTDLIRLLDAQRAQLDADLVWVHAVTDVQESAAAVRLAAGEIK
jgi:cobalt-zinc-cadmium efflux system outer membrane protein